MFESLNPDSDQSRESYLSAHAYSFVQDGSVYYVIDKRNGDRTPIGSDDRGGRSQALKDAKAFVEKTLQERAAVAERAEAYRRQVNR